VAAIAEAHHGSVRVTSSVGRGSTFELVVPTTRETANGSEPPTVRSGQSSLSRTYGSDSPASATRRRAPASRRRASWWAGRCRPPARP
jgi:hypothetical protein